MRQRCNFRTAAIASSGPSHAASRTRPCCLLFAYTAGLNGQERSLFALLWCFSKHEWRLERVRNPCRLVWNGETARSAYQRSSCLDICFSWQATRGLHYAASRTPETMLGRWDLSNLASRRAVLWGEVPSKLSPVHQQCVSAVRVAFSRVL
jgi:hypothetical protein